MCKVLIIPGLKKENKEVTTMFVHEMTRLISVANDDGLGYAAINHDGDLFGERWFVNSNAFKNKGIDVPDAMVSLTPFIGKPTDGCEYNSFGVIDWDNMAAITLHARMATTSKVFMNTHPFVEGETSLIHNGVIRNHDMFDKKTTCDSEAILRSYIDNEVNFDIKNTQQMISSLIGYYACGVFSYDANSNRILDVFKANGANLWVAYIVELGTYVFSTSISDVDTACNKLGLTVKYKAEVKEENLLRINPFTGEIEDYMDFKAGPNYESYSQTNYNHKPTNRFKQKKSATSSQMISYLEKLPSVSVMTEKEQDDFSFRNFIYA